MEIISNANLWRDYKQGGSNIYSSAGRPRCQVTPYVVNVLLVLVLVVGGTVSYIQVCQPIEAFLGHTLLHNFCSASPPTYSEGVGEGGGWARLIYPPSQNDALDLRK